jgi:hypothetical protein
MDNILVAFEKHNFVVNNLKSTGNPPWCKKNYLNMSRNKDARALTRFDTNI